jgi:hypothetical protein
LVDRNTSEVPVAFQSLSLTKPSTNVVNPPATPPNYGFPCNARYNYSGIGGLSGLFVVDGVTLLAGYRVFVVNALDAVQSGLYSASAGAWYRAQDMIVGDDAAATRFVVTAGTVYSNTNWVCTNSVGAGIVGTDPLFFDPYSLGSPAYTVATGGTVTDVNIGGILYRLHTFTSSGTFTVTQLGNSNVVDYLVVAGGGSGGGSGGSGGGGGGGVRSSVSTVALGAYPVVVGPGGTAYTTANGWRGNSGGNSSWNGVVSIGGGAGAGAFSAVGSAALAGGSGGGGSRLVTAAGAGTAGQGFAGGIGRVFSASNAPGGGGGGAGGVGGAPTGTPAQGAGGVGGVGLQLSITGTPTYYGGGGGGAFYQYGINPTSFAPGGLGGGGIGGFSTFSTSFSGTAGTNGLGGGGGAAGRTATGANPTPGGSGVVIIRYQIG